MILHSILPYQYNTFQHHVSITEEQANIAERQVSITKQVGITK